MKPGEADGAGSGHGGVPAEPVHRRRAPGLDAVAPRESDERCRWLDTPTAVDGKACDGRHETGHQDGGRAALITEDEQLPEWLFKTLNQAVIETPLQKEMTSTSATKAPLGRLGQWQLPRRHARQGCVD